MGCLVGTRSWNVTARSRHPGGLNALFCDGSTHYIQNNIGQRTWFLLHSFNDGESVDWN